MLEFDERALGAALTRRTMFAAGGLGLALAAGASIPQAEAAAAGGGETANVKLVGDFCKIWADKEIDVDKAVATYFAEDCRLNLVEGQAPAVGKAAASGLLNAFLKTGDRYDLKILKTFAEGPVVVNSRIDTKLTNGKPVEKDPVVGVFIVKDGKIKEWSDYPVPKA